MNGSSIPPFRTATIVARKEIRDALRDRRSLLTVMLFPAMSILIVVAIVGLFKQVRSEAETFEVPVMQAEHAPEDLQRSFARQGMTWKTWSGDPEDAVESGNEAFVLVFARPSASPFDPRVIHLYYDGSKESSRSSINKIEAVLAAYGNTIGVSRLVSRGIAPSVVRPVTLVRRDVATEQQLGASLLRNVPMFILMAAFISGIATAIDITAGERERRSLEPLLTNPGSRLAIVIGKWVAASMFCYGGLILTLIASVITLRTVDLEALGVTMQLGTKALVIIASIGLPLAMMAAALEMLVGIFSKSFKEAQSYASLVSLVPVLPMMYLAFVSIDLNPAYIATPVVGQQLLVNHVVAGESISWGAIILASGPTLLVAMGCLWATARIFDSERVVHG